MGDLTPQGAWGPARRFAPLRKSVAQARRFVRAALEGVAPDTVDTAELLAGELVTNVVRHAGTEAEVSAGSRDGVVRVRVTDHRPDRGVVLWGCQPYAGTGLGLVERLAHRYGVDTGEDHKTVWFQLGSDGSPAGAAPGWRTTVPPYARRDTVTLFDVPGALYRASQQHRHALLRELALAAGAGDTLGVRPEDLATACDMSDVLNAGMTAALEQQPHDGDMRSLPLSVPADAAPAVVTLRRTLDRAEEAAREGDLLTLPALPRCRAFHDWLFDQILAQTAGDDPTAWTVIPREPGAGPSELVPWDARHVHASRVPTIAADDGNRILAVNGPAADLLGWHADELVGRRLTTLIPEHLRKRHRSAFTSLLLTGTPRILGRSVPLPALHRDGRLVPVRLFLQTQETTDGRTVFVAQLAPRAAAAHAPRAPGRSRQAALREPGGHYPPTGEGDGQPLTDGGGPPPATGRPESPPPVRAEPEMPALQRLALLADIGTALSNAPDLEEGLRQVGVSLTRRLADWCAVDLLDEDGVLERVCVVHRDPGDTPPETYEGRLPAVTESARGPLARALRGAGPLLLTEAPPPSQASSPLDAHYLDVLNRLGTTSAVVAPLRARRAVFGVLTVARTGRGRPFTEGDLSLVDDLVSGLALGVDNARLHQETRNIAERLQRSLLPVLPDVPSLALAARYAASSATAQVGGDWYDSFLLPSGNTALVIGDVTGHNLDAAIAMSQLRSMLRGIAVDRQEPPEVVLRRLDMANHSLYREATATCIYGLVKGPEEGPWELHYSSAGHLPPLLTTAEGEVRYLEEGSGLLLGMDPDMPRPRASCTLPAHSTVLLYTDGLIERRGESLDRALGRLRRRAAALAREPLDIFCDELLIGLGADNTDDIAMLALRPVPPLVPPH
ncbi:SpoIIE family protein phosphatase [Streptomyces pactum]|uniref:SpoIIE family protein phosphatase n=1 Tax=Streptomyces pactum TaxID=68249 RepID=UPI0036FA9183